MDLVASAPSFAAGAGVWSAALALISASPVMPAFIWVSGAIASVLFAVTAIRMFGGGGLTPVSEPLPFYADPFLAITLFGRASAHVRSTPVRKQPASDNGLLNVVVADAHRWWT